MKGIILAGGSGTRLYPLTLTVCKQLLPLYDKPMIYYPLSVLMLAGIKDILIISTPTDVPNFQKIFGDGSHLGVRFSYAIQEQPNGLAEAFLIGEDFIGSESVCLILGDNIFYGQGLGKLLRRAVAGVEKEGGSTIFGYSVQDPERYGVVAFDQAGTVLSIIEKPENPQSNYAVTGIYFYDNQVIAIASNIEPSARGELEITDINSAYLAQGNLRIERLGRGFAWLDTGTHESLLEAGVFIEMVEKRQGLKIACIEEIAYRLGYIDKNQIIALIAQMKKNGYAHYLEQLITEDSLNAF